MAEFINIQLNPAKLRKEKTISTTIRMDEDTKGKFLELKNKYKCTSRDLLSYIINIVYDGICSKKNNKPMGTE